MTGSTARRVAIRGSVLVAASLFAAGFATAVVLHVRARAALDQALLAAAHGEAHPTAWRSSDDYPAAMAATATCSPPPAAPRRPDRSDAQRVSRRSGRSRIP